MKSYRIHLPDSRSRLPSVKTKDGKFLKEMRWQSVDEWWVRQHLGVEVLAILEKEGKYEDENKEIVIFKVKTEKEGGSPERGV